MSFWSIFHETTGVPVRPEWILVAFASVAAALMFRLPKERKRILAACSIFFLAALVLLAATVLRVGGWLGDSPGIKSDVYVWVAGIGTLLLCIAAINLVAVVVFDIVLFALGLRPPAILRDILLFAAYVVTGLTLLSRAGVSITGIVATSTVVSAVIGLSMQDTLGNVVGGMALQVERSVNEGDWIRVGDVEGRVLEVHWRHTAVETRNFDTVYIPNSVLMKSTVTVLGRRDGRPTFHRQLVNFYVDYRHAPALVIEIVERAIQAGDIPLVAAEPRPNCVMLDFRDSYGHYCARYWLTDLAANDPGDSGVRSRIYAALRREGITPSIPAQAVFLTKESKSRRQRKIAEEVERGAAALRQVSIFAPLSDEEVHTLAPRLRAAIFAKGEVITRQGAEAHWLYIMTKGHAYAEICTEPAGLCRRIGEFGPGDFFGEMGLLTGAKRVANIIAETDVACYRLEKEAFRGIIESRPAIAEAMSGLLAERRAQIDMVREGLNEEAAKHRAQASRGDVLAAIKRFFLLDQ